MVETVRRMLGRVALVVAGPVVLFTGAEMLLALGGFFEPVEVLRQVDHAGERYWVMEPEYTRHVLGRDNVKTEQRSFIPVQRAEGTKRVLLIGGSAAAGYPAVEHGIGRMLRVLWERDFPDQSLEVVDMTSVGVNSHILRIFLREGLKTDPDAVVIYAGNNEVIGPYGAANVFGQQLPTPAWAQIGLALGNTRIGLALKSAMRGWMGQPVESWRGLDEFGAVRLDWEAPAMKRVAAQAKANYRAMVDMALDHGSKVLVCVPAVNLTDWPPMAGDSVDGRPPAKAAYAKGRELEKAGSVALAWGWYREACDLDEVRFRADSRVRDAQRQVVAEVDSPEVVLVDADIWLHEGNPTLQSDRDFFLEHVHLTFEGRVAVAALLVDGLKMLFGQRENAEQDSADWWAGFPVEVASVREAIMFTEVEEGGMWRAVESLLRMGVFSNVEGMGERKRRIRARIRELDEMAEKWNDASAVRIAYQRATEINPLDADLHETAARHLGKAGDIKSARQALERAVELRPNLARANLALAKLALEDGRVDETRRITDRATAFQRGGTMLDGIRAALLAKEGEYQQAITALKPYITRWPDDTQAIDLLASLQDQQGDRKEAERLYRIVLERQPTSAATLNNLAWLLATRTRSTSTEREEAVVLAQRAVELDPDAHRYRGTLAVALLAKGDLDRGAEEADKALAMAVAAGDAEAVELLSKYRSGVGSGGP